MYETCCILGYGVTWYETRFTRTVRFASFNCRKLSRATERFLWAETMELYGVVYRRGYACEGV